MKLMQEFMQELLLASSTPRKGAADDGKRASSAIEVAIQGASPLEGGLGETIWAQITWF